MEIDNSETEAVSKPDEEDKTHPPKPGSSECRRASSTSSHRDELIADEEETRATAEALESHYNELRILTSHLPGKTSISGVLVSWKTS